MIGLFIAAKETVHFRKMQMSLMLALLVIAATGLLSCGGSGTTSPNSSA